MSAKDIFYLLIALLTWMLRPAHLSHFGRTSWKLIQLTVLRIGLHGCLVIVAAEATLTLVAVLAILFIVLR